MPSITLTFDRRNPQPFKIDGSFEITNFELDETRASIEFTISISDAINTLFKLDKYTSFGYKLLMQDFQNDNQYTLKYHHLRFDTRNIKELFNRNDFLTEGLINPLQLDPRLLNGFTIDAETSIDGDVELHLDRQYIFFKRKLNVSVGASISRPGTRTMGITDVPFIRFLHMLLKDFLGDKFPITTMPFDLSTEEKVYMNIVNTGILLYFLKQCEDKKIPVKLSDRYQSMLRSNDRDVKANTQKLLDKYAPERQPVATALTPVFIAPAAVTHVLTPMDTSALPTMDTSAPTVDPQSDTPKEFRIPSNN